MGVDSDHWLRFHDDSGAARAGRVATLFWNSPRWETDAAVILKALPDLASAPRFRQPELHGGGAYPALQPRPEARGGRISR